MTDQSPAPATPDRRYRVPALLLGVLSGAELLMATAFAAGAMLLAPGAVTETDVMYSGFSAIVDMLWMAAGIFGVLGFAQMALAFALWRSKRGAAPLTYVASALGCLLSLLLLIAGLNGTGISFFEISLLAGYAAVGGTLLGARRS